MTSRIWSILRTFGNWNISASTYCTRGTVNSTHWGFWWKAQYMQYSKLHKNKLIAYNNTTNTHKEMEISTTEKLNTFGDFGWCHPIRASLSDWANLSNKNSSLSNVKSYFYVTCGFLTNDLLPIFCNRVNIHSHICTSII